jgi:hypothetical protein
MLRMKRRFDSVCLLAEGKAGLQKIKGISYGIFKVIKIKKNDQ